MTALYCLEVPGQGIMFEANHLRREKHELFGELRVKCSLPSARSANGYINISDFNFSSLRARQDRAKFLAERAGTNGKLDWFAFLEELCQGVFQAEQDGEPALDLRQLPRPERGDDIKIDGLVFPKRHPSILFGDGGAAKSYTALYFAGQLAQRGLNVVLFDWELCGEDHRERLERLFGPTMPRILYCRCDRPLTSEAHRLTQVVREHHIDYAIYDSIAFACNGRPEEAEVTSQYFRAVREIGCGSLHVAHVNRSEDNDRKPFGSSFWHNGARSTWFVQAVETAGDDKTLRLGFFNRKANLGPLHRAVSFVVDFNADRTIFRSAEVMDNADLASKLSVKQRVYYLLRHGAKPIEEIAAEIGEKPDTVRRTVQRYKSEFIVLASGMVGLKGVAI